MWLTKHLKMRRLSCIICCCYSVTKLCPTFCIPMNCSTLSSSILHSLPEFAEIMSIESVMPSNRLILCHSLLLLPSIFPSMKDFSSSSHQVVKSIGASALASVLPVNIQDWFPLGLTGWISLQSKGLSRVFSNTTVQKHQLFSAQLSLWSSSHIHTWLLKKPELWLHGPLLAK